MPPEYRTGREVSPEPAHSASPLLLPPMRQDAPDVRPNYDSRTGRRIYYDIETGEKSHITEVEPTLKLPGWWTIDLSMNVLGWIGLSILIILETFYIFYLLYTR